MLRLAFLFPGVVEPAANFAWVPIQWELKFLDFLQTWLSGCTCCSRGRTVLENHIFHLYRICGNRNTLLCDRPGLLSFFCAGQVHVSRQLDAERQKSKHSVLYHLESQKNAQFRLDCPDIWET